MVANTDQKIRDILTRVKNIALIGASSSPDRPSFKVMSYLQSNGYRVIPVNPGLVGQKLLGEYVYASLLDIREKIEMVDIFRAVDAVPAIVEEAIQIKAGYIWMQLGITHAEAAARAESHGIEIIMDRCPKIEIERLGILP